MIQIEYVSHPGGYYWDLYFGALSLGQITATHLKIVHP